MSGLIPTIKGAENAPLIDDENVAENDNSSNNDPYNGQTTENALNPLRNPADESIFDGTDITPTVHKSNNSAQVANSYELGPGRVPSNKPGTLYSL